MTPERLVEWGVAVAAFGGGCVIGACLLACALAVVASVVHGKAE